ncbi:hypothetical protein LJ656_06330 [Paraburkholderia sp. MMS20-SJTR3]|uniref:Cellulose biosynthesis protein BcsF n=1 Tax=Paraburkholderia sejongensis TaxID=2886946 RepID=A0ABS8JQK8_9BURK|nr:hypothetical protein [Paraburkholderia sp. MMS20-SJTR3]MCC8392201.1 hypothetical protein [Paraburkholderia sp. MMS20-SJTR3]
MSETWMGLTITGVALLIAMPLIFSHYRRERRRRQLLRNLDHEQWWYQARPGVTATRVFSKTNR